MNDWKTLTIAISQTLDPVGDYLSRLKEKPRLGSTDRTTIEVLAKEFKNKQAAIKQAQLDYKAGKIRIKVATGEEPAFRGLVQNLSQHTAQIHAKETRLSVTDLRKYQKYLTAFLSVGPHGPGDGDPGGPGASGAGDPEPKGRTKLKGRI